MNAKLLSENQKPNPFLFIESGNDRRIECAICGDMFLSKNRTMRTCPGCLRSNVSVRKLSWNPALSLKRLAAIVVNPELPC